MSKKVPTFQWQELLVIHLTKAKKPLVVILGPTASGKTAFSIELAKEAEIINADSRQLYKYLDTGTAKITQEDMQGIPHHLFSVLDPKEEATIAWYKERATQTIDSVLTRGNIPILVGGSMLYISAIIDGLQPLPAADPVIRKRLAEEYEKDRGMTLHQKLWNIDPESAAAIHPNNKVYLIRALEIYETTKQPASKQKQQSACPYDLLIFGMRWPRGELVKRIEERTKTLLGISFVTDTSPPQTWLQEVSWLLAHGYTTSDHGMKSHGYREIAEWILRGRKEEEFPSLMERINTVTRQYAKRQITWWRNDERIRWIRADGVVCQP